MFWIRHNIINYDSFKLSNQIEISYIIASTIDPEPQRAYLYVCGALLFVMDYIVWNN